jgi:predicted nucleotidyltransferase
MSHQPRAILPTMKDISEITKQLKEKLPLLSSKYKIEALGLFGSYVRDEQQENSDLDLLVSFSEPPSLLKFMELENYLSDILHTKVDLVMKEALKPNLGKRILKEVVML